MAKEYVCGVTARKKLGCDKDRFIQLINTGAIEAERTENGSWRVSSASIDEYLAANEKDYITKLEEENKRLKEQIEMYKKRFREIKRILPEEI